MSNMFHVTNRYLAPPGDQRTRCYTGYLGDSQWPVTITVPAEADWWPGQEIDLTGIEVTDVEG
jgi:hypothetical protein